jgi:AraC-like DNA-binding protein
MPEHVQHRPSTLAERERLFAEVVAEIDSRLCEPQLELDDVARAVYASRRQVQRVMEEHDTSFRQYLTRARMRRAAEMLADQPARPVRDVAHTVGYRQPAQFAKAFRRVHGQTPAAHRRNGLARAALALGPEPGAETERLAA